MKSFVENIVKVAFIAIITITTTSCSNVGGTRVINSATGGGGGYTTKTTYQSVTKTVAPKSTVGLEIYGNQPQDPTPAARSNPTTWGATHGGSQAYNEMRPKSYAKLETPDPTTPILIDKSTGWIWKGLCHNRMVPAQSREVTEQVPTTIQVPQPQVAAAGGNVNVDNSVHIETGLNNFFAGATGIVQEVVRKGMVCEPIPSNYYPQNRGYRPPQNCPPPRMQPPPQQRIPACPRCGVVHPGRPCQQQGGPTINRTTYRVHNNNEDYNLNVRNAPGNYYPQQGSGYRSSSPQGRPFGNGSPDSSYSRIPGTVGYDGNGNRRW